jgi:hypothetical protein
VRDRLARLAPEEIAAGVLLVAGVFAVVVQPQSVGRIFESPYATPAPESGAASYLRSVDTTYPSDRWTTRRVDRSGWITWIDSAPSPRTVRPVFVVTFDRVGRTLQAPTSCAEANRGALGDAGAYVVCMPSPPGAEKPPSVVRPPSP